MGPSSQFALTIAKSKDGQDWSTVSAGRWTPPDPPTLDGEILPDAVVEKLTRMDLTGFSDGGSHNVRYKDWYYRFDLIKKETGTPSV